MDLSIFGAGTLARIYLRSKIGRVPRLIPTHLPALRPTFLYSLHSLTSPPLTERNRQRDDSVCMRECIYVCLLNIYVHIFCSYCPFMHACMPCWLSIRTTSCTSCESHEPQNIHFPARLRTTHGPSSKQINHKRISDLIK